MGLSTNLSFLREQKAQRTWLALVILWALIRSIVVRDVFGKYGIDGWVYFSIDLCSGIPYAIYSGRAVVNVLDKDWHSIRKNGLMALVCFYIPDLFILICANEIPNSLLIGFLCSIAIFSLFAIYGLKRDIKGKPKS